ncbi:MAG: tRNA (adenosine(37)-N6)-threonylcarbamoyltransferase complex dimerization subunit type 1 TsaB [Microbacterium sp.]|nr:MAG: tRNA (adenosine(37)-N6)-threonylcarbamoyltransferase complex dimerization subunit type 1 TsaB [Microbacterium sp.]
MPRRPGSSGSAAGPEREAFRLGLRPSLNARWLEHSARRTAAPRTLEGVILGIDTSLGTAVAVVEADGVVRSEASSDNPLGHAEAIGTLLQTALADAARGPIGQTSAAEPVTLTHVAAGMGPGPFTGLRVGIAAARAFALARDLPVVAVPSHDAAALAVILGAALADPFGDDERFAIVTDARRREFAYSIYDGIDDDGIPLRVEGPALVPRDAIDAVLADHGARRHDVTAISAAMIGALAARAVAAGRTLTGPEPLYLRAPDVTLPAGPKRVSA